MKYPIHFPKYQLDLLSWLKKHFAYNCIDCFYFKLLGMQQTSGAMHLMQYKLII